MIGRYEVTVKVEPGGVFVSEYRDRDGTLVKTERSNTGAERTAETIRWLFRDFGGRE